MEGNRQEASLEELLLGTLLGYVHIPDEWKDPVGKEF